MSLELILLLRLLAAALFGGIIGLEREYRSKEAGLRTHFLVCFGSALFMIVSQYGFVDSMPRLLELCGSEVDVRMDVGRVAAQVVSGIGFICAGTIVLQKRFVVGLTTAAGLWTAAAIGMAVGGGLYLVGFFGTLLTLAGFEALRKISHTIGNVKKEMRIAFYADTLEAAKAVADGLQAEGRAIISYSSVRAGDRHYVKISLDTPERSVNASALLAFLHEAPGVETELVE